MNEMTLSNTRGAARNDGATKNHRQLRGSVEDLLCEAAAVFPAAVFYQLTGKQALINPLYSSPPPLHGQLKRQGLFSRVVETKTEQKTESIGLGFIRWTQTTANE